MSRRMSRAVVVLALVAAGGCRESAPAARAESAQIAPPTSSPPIAQAQPRALDFGPGGPLDVVPKIPPFEKGMMDHAFAVGWSRTGEALGECHQAMVLLCELRPLAGKTESLSVTPGGPEQAQKERALRARAAAMGFGTVAGEWPFARDLEVTWLAIIGSQVTNPPLLGVLKVGARVRGEKASFLISLSEKATGYHDRIHPEAIALSPDGKYLGVVAHAFSGEYGDAFPMAIVPVARVAAQAYNDAGFAHHQANDVSAAALLFEKATAADPTFALPAYNLACAFARLGDPGTEAALREAISRGGDAVKERAQKDTDFAGVRSAAWFVAATK